MVRLNYKIVQEVNKLLHDVMHYCISLFCCNLFSLKVNTKYSNNNISKNGFIILLDHC